MVSSRSREPTCAAASLLFVWIASPPCEACAAKYRQCGHPVLDDSQRDGCIGHGSSMWANSVLSMGDRDHAGTAGQTDGRVDSNDAVDIRGANDAAVGLGTKRNRGEISRDGGAGPGARAAGVTVD